MSDEDVDAKRAAINELWEQAAAGWSRQQAVWGAQSAPVARWLVDAIEPRPGMRVLDLAAGTGEVGFGALPRIQPGGTLICSDQAEAMVEVARRRAADAGLEGVEFRVLDGEWIDLELASVDGVLCRWGYMLMADPAAALRETRRVLRPGGRVALAVWDRRDLNPWSTVPTEVLVSFGLAEPPNAADPGPYSMADPELVRSMLEEAGFGEIRIDSVDVPRTAPDFDSWWATHLDLSVATRTAFERADEERTYAVEAEIARRLKRYAAPDGSLAVPGRTLVAAAEA
jgi:ubiquinone/menaquinone biosynthesis C-methylase UbiE